MFELFLVYFWLKIDTITDIVYFVSIGSLIIGIGKYCLYYAAHQMHKSIVHDPDYQKESDRVESREFLENENSYYKKYTKWGMTFILVGIMILGLSKLMPTQKELSILIAAGYTVKAIESPEVQKLVAVAKGMANNWMDEQLKNERK